MSIAECPAHRRRRRPTEILHARRAAAPAEIPLPLPAFDWYAYGRERTVGQSLRARRAHAGLLTITHAPVLGAGHPSSLEQTDPDAVEAFVRRGPYRA